MSYDNSNSNLPDDPESSSAQEPEEWRAKIADFVLLILHGDAVHQAWLRDAGEAFILGKPIPAPRDNRKFTCAYCGKGANELDSPHYLERVNLLGDVPAVWMCTEHLAVNAALSSLREKQKKRYERSSWLKEAPSDLVEAQRLITNLKQLVIDDCEDDTLIRDMIRPTLGEKETDGDSYGVPGIPDLVETLLHKMVALREKIKALEEKEAVSDRVQPVLQNATDLLIDAETELLLLTRQYELTCEVAKTDTTYRGATRGKLLVHIQRFLSEHSNENQSTTPLNKDAEIRALRAELQEAEKKLQLCANEYQGLKRVRREETRKLLELKEPDSDHVNAVRPKALLEDSLSALLALSPFYRRNPIWEAARIHETIHALQGFLSENSNEAGAHPLIQNSEALSSSESVDKGEAETHEYIGFGDEPGLCKICSQDEHHPNHAGYE